MKLLRLVFLQKIAKALRARISTPVNSHQINQSRRFENLPLLLGSIGGSAVLQDQSQIRDAEMLCDLSGIEKHHDATKTWDLLGFLATVMRYMPDKTASILDAGSGSKAVVASRLVDLGFTNISACDLKPVLQKSKNRERITYYSSKFEELPVRDGEFDVIVSMSVIEHVDDPLKSLVALTKKLKIGGLLIVSTDYWPDKIDCAGIYPYGVDMPEMRIFSAEELLALVDDLATCGLKLLEEFSPRADKQVCVWERVGREYTFARLVFRRYA